MWLLAAMLAFITAWPPGAIAVRDGLRGAQSKPSPEYWCPMHPDVRGAKGDSCPRCGMKLVPAPRA